MRPYCWIRSGSFQLCWVVWIDNPNFIWPITTLVGFLIYDFCSYYSPRIILFVSNVWQVGCSLARINSRAVLHFPSLSVIYSNYNQCLCAVQIKHGDNKRALKRHARGRWNVPKGRWGGWVGVQKCESNTATPWILSQWRTAALHNQPRRNCIKLHWQVFLSVKPIITYMSAQLKNYLLGVRVSHIWSKNLPLQAHLMKYLHNKQTLNRRIFVSSLEHKEMRTASLLLLRRLFVLQRRVSDIQVPILWRSWFPPPRVLEQLPQEVQS